MELGLKGKVAFITGGSVGIGLAVAKAFAAEGVDVAIGARQEERVLAEASGIASEYGVRALGLAMDVTVPVDIDNALQKIEESFGGIDILVNNAGSGSEGDACPGLH